MECGVWSHLHLLQMSVTSQTGNANSETQAALACHQPCSSFGELEAKLLKTNFGQLILCLSIYTFNTYYCFNLLVLTAEELIAAVPYMFPSRFTSLNVAKDIFWLQRNCRQSQKSNQMIHNRVEWYVTFQATCLFWQFSLSLHKIWQL